MAIWSFFRKLSKRFLITLNVMLAVAFLLACGQPWLNPETFWFIAFLSLAMPYLLLLVVAFAVFWLIVKPRLVFISLAVLLLGYRQIAVLFNLSDQGFSMTKKAKHFRILSWNIKAFQGNGGGKAEKRENATRTFRLLEDLNADVVCFQEFGQYDKPGLGENYTAQMQALGYPYFVLSKDYSRVKYFYTSGLAIFSRHPIVAKKRIPFASSPESLLYADILTPLGDTVRVFTVHLQSFRFTEKEFDVLDKASEDEARVVENSRNIVAKMKRAFRNRGAQADQVLPVVDSSSHPVILAGDFNDVPGSYAYWRIRGKRQDAFLEKGQGIGRTFISLAPTLRIDFVFADEQLAVEQFTTLRQQHSDHLPVVADMLLSAAAPATPDKPAGKSRQDIH